MKPTILPKTQHFTLRVDVLELCDLPLKDKLSGEKVPQPFIVMPI